MDIFLLIDQFKSASFEGILVEDDIPESESLKDLIEKRTVPFWSSVVQPDILGWCVSIKLFMI